MQTPKISLVICALALVSTLTIRAADNAAQAAARTALAAKLFEVGSQEATNPPAATTKAVVKEAATTVVIAAPAVKAAPVTEPALVPISAEAKAKAKAQAKAKAKADKLAAEAKAKAEAEQAAADKKAKKEAAKIAAAKKEADEAAARAAAKASAKAAAPAPVKIEPAPVATAQSAPKVMAAANGDNPAQAAARAALVKKLFETSQTQSGWEAPKNAAPTKEAKPVAKVEKPKAATKPVAKPVAVAAKPVEPKGNFAAAAPSLKAVEVPASPLPLSKQQKLQALLVKYKADQITPAEYFSQRTAILNEP